LLNLDPSAFAILDHLVGPEAQHAPAGLLHHRCPPRVGFDLKSMMIPIYLDDDLAGDAGEVGKVRADGMLAAELDARHATIAQEFPGNLLRTTTITTQFAGSFRCFVLHHPLT